MSSSDAILREIRTAAKRLGIAPSTLCQRAVKNAKLVGRLEDGQTITLETAEKLRAYIARELRRQPASEPARATG